MRETGAPTPTPEARRFLDAEPDEGFDVFRWMLGGYLVLIFAAFVALEAGDVTSGGAELSTRRKLFVVVNAATLTGFQQDFALDLFSADNVLGPVVLLTLTLAGTLFSLVAGGMAMTRILGLPYADRQVLASGCVFTLVATLGGAAALYGSERSLFAALLQAASAFGNSGVYEGPLSGPAGWQTHLVLMPLAFLGGLGLTVLMELLDAATGGRRLSPHARTVLVASAGLYLAAFVLLAAQQSPPQLPSTVEEREGFREAVAVSSVQALNARTAGFPFESVSALPRTAQWTLILFMLVGASPGGTGGGLKTTTCAVLLGGVRSALRGRGVSRAFGIAAVWLGTYLAVALVGFVLLLWSEPDLQDDRLMFLSVSAASNVGLSHDPITIAGNGLFYVSAMMLAGRVAPLLVLWWMARTTQAEELAVG